MLSESQKLDRIESAINRQTEAISHVGNLSELCLLAIVGILLYQSIEFWSVLVCFGIILLSGIFTIIYSRRNKF